MTGVKITVVGGSSGTGKVLAEAAIAAGHEVTVVSRSGTAPAGAATVTGSTPIPGSPATRSPARMPSWSPSAARRAFTISARR